MEARANCFCFRVWDKCLRVEKSGWWIDIWCQCHVLATLTVLSDDGRTNFSMELMVLRYGSSSLLPGALVFFV